MRHVLRENRNIIAASVLAGGIMLAPVAAQAAIAGAVTVSGTGSATCPTGYKIAGGGFKVPNDSFSSTSSNEYKVTSSGPVSGVRWTATAMKVSGGMQYNGKWVTTTYDHAPQVWAVCVK